MTRVLLIVLLFAVAAHASPLMSAMDDPDYGHPSRPQARRVYLDVGRNLRTLGGLPARGGWVREDTFYRSSRLGHIGGKDVERLNALRLSTLIDLRFWLERFYQGPDTHAVMKHIPHRVWLPMMATPFHGDQFYAHILIWKKDRNSIRKFFEILAKPESYPLLVHCGVGKDRTAVMVAVTLDLLGTPRNVIMDDFLASGKEMKPVWLQAAFDLIDARGGIEAFVRGYGISEGQIVAIRQNLIAPRAPLPKEGRPTDG
jgi:hypothetical protein